MEIYKIIEVYFSGLSEKIVELSPRISSAIMILLIALIASVITRRIVLSVAFKKRLSGQKMEITKLIVSAVSTTIIILGIASSLGTLGVNISALIAGLGLSGFALGFALRDALSNLLSGILIILYQPFKVGDRIIVAGFEGRVCEINLRYTILDSGAENKYLIPNANIFNNTVTVKRENSE